MYRPCYQAIAFLALGVAGGLIASQCQAADSSAWMEITPAAPYTIHNNTLEVDSGVPFSLHVRGISSAGTVMTLEAPQLSDKTQAFQWHPLSGDKPEAELVLQPSAGHDVTLRFESQLTGQKDGTQHQGPGQTLTLLVKEPTESSTHGPVMDTAQLRDHYDCIAGRTLHIPLAARASSANGKVDFMVHASPDIAKKIRIGKLEHPSSQTWSRKLSLKTDQAILSAQKAYQIEVIAIDYTLPHQPQSSSTISVCAPQS